jgi:hypothetical protein
MGICQKSAAISGQAKNEKISFTASRRNTGRVSNPRAFRKLEDQNYQERTPLIFIDRDPLIIFITFKKRPPDKTLN